MITKTTYFRFINFILLITLVLSFFIINSNKSVDFTNEKKSDSFSHYKIEISSLVSIKHLEDNFFSVDNNTLKNITRFGKIKSLNLYILLAIISFFLFFKLKFYHFKILISKVLSNIHSAIQFIHNKDGTKSKYSFI